VGRYVVRRLLQLVPVFFGTTFLIYGLVFLLPGDPIQRLFGERQPDPTQAARLRDAYNLDDSFIVQYLKYIGGVLTGDFGTTYTGREVSQILLERWPITLQLALTAIVIEIVFGIGLGLLAGIRRGGFADRTVLVTTLVVVSIPVFVLGIVVQYIFGVKLGWFPATGITDGWPMSYLLPATVIAALSLAYVARLTRTSLVENLRTDYVRTAVAKGLPRRRVIGVHAFRNSLIPVVTFIGADLGFLMAGAVVTEGIFNIPGIGNALFTAVRLGEAPVVVGITTFLVVMILLVNLLVDVLYGVLDPRIRYE
jgi:peptide/nickel transport system permease protein/oligopeptide transport system permease protein